MNNYLKIFLVNTIALIRSIRLKSNITAEALNDLDRLRGFPVDELKPKTWRYYLNLQGEYHPANEVMYITSHDTYELIELNKANLLIHLLTTRNYYVGGQYYKELVDRYPDQEILIQGIFNPVPFDKSIDALDHQILSYNTALIEGNEQYLIPNLQLYIDNFFSNRHNPNYPLIEPNYYVKLLSGLSTKLVLEVLRLRQTVCKTEKAHSFHVRHFLLSYSKIGLEFRYMTHDQQLWFYKNIHYINRNVGKESIFTTLVDKVLTARGYSLVGYDLAKTKEGLLEYLKPNLEFKQIQINRIPPATGTGDKSMNSIYTKERDVAPDNRLLMDGHVIKTREVGETSAYGSVPTKVLESNTLDRSDSEPFTISEITLNHWLYLGTIGAYNSIVQLTNPSNGERYRLNMKDAFTTFLYCYNKGLGIELLHVPNLTANRVIRHPLPNFKELRRLASTELVPDYYIRHILNTQPELGTYVSIDAFRGFCREVWATLFRHREMRFLSGNYRREGELHTLVDRCYADIPINLANEVTYNEWLNLKGINLSTMAPSDFMTLAQTILSTCTGADLNETTGMKENHAAMLRIMRSLSPYSVQFVAEINDSSIKVIDGKFPTLADNSYIDNLVFTYDLYAPRVMRIKSKTLELRNVNVDIKYMGGKIHDGISKVDVEVDVKLLSVSSPLDRSGVELILPQVSLARLEERALDQEVITNNPTDVIPVIQPSINVPVFDGWGISTPRLDNFLAIHKPKIPRIDRYFTKQTHYGLVSTPRAEAFIYLRNIKHTGLISRPSISDKLTTNAHEGIVTKPFIVNDYLNVDHHEGLTKE